MKVSHELPLSLLKYGYEWNDYDYALPLFLERYDIYRKYFTKARIDNRFIILDNGLFEGHFHSNSELIKSIEKIEPDIFIVPDAWNDAITTIRSAKSWIINYKKDLPERTKLMAVLQGKSMGELITSYQTLLDLGYTHIALNHSSDAYLKLYPDLPRLEAQVKGRISLVSNLISSNLLNLNGYHHLLGCSLPQEFKHYFGIEPIKSVDTSNPILVGAEGKRYEDIGIDWKPTQKLEHYFEKDLEGSLEDIIFNVNKFKEFTK